jgi:hypothetical protein
MERNKGTQKEKEKKKKIWRDSKVKRKKVKKMERLRGIKREIERDIKMFLINFY